MYSKHEAALIKRNFWTRFGQYMRPVKSAAGENVNWLNYKTGIRNVFFRMDADQYKASIAIEIRHIHHEERMHYFNQFVALKNLMQQTTTYEWLWQPEVTDENGQCISSISQVLNNVNVLNEADWPTIIAFLKPRIISLDTFWEMVKDGFE